MKNKLKLRMYNTNCMRYIQIIDIKTGKVLIAIRGSRLNNLRLVIRLVS